MAGFYILGLYLPDLSMCVCASVPTCVVASWLFQSLRRCSQTQGAGHSHQRDESNLDPKVQDGGVGLGDGCFMIFCVHESDLLGFMKIYVVLLSLSIRYVEMSWDILYIWELGGLCCVVGWNFQILFQDLVKIIFHERTWVCFWSCLETKT